MDMDKANIGSDFVFTRAADGQRHRESRVVDDDDRGDDDATRTRVRRRAWRRE